MAQAVQTAVAPMPEEYAPTPQDEQLAAKLAPVPVQYVPALHALHDIDPAPEV